MPGQENVHACQGASHPIKNIYVRKGAGNFVKDRAVEHFVPGIGKLRSAGMAYNKCMDLTEVLQKYFQDTSEYDGQPIKALDVKQAIKYVISKKIRKSVRQGMKGTIIMGAAVAGAATGATVGSVIPVAGTVAGGAAGYVALSSAATAVVVGGDKLVRTLKGAYKLLIAHTRGVHREQAATSLYLCWGAREDTTYGAAAEEALQIILGDEYDHVMAKGPQDAVIRIAQRLKS